MTARPIHLERVDIVRALGIGRGHGFVLSGLVPGINLIVGPNGSGKSTTATVIKELLWPGANGLDRPTVSGVLRDGPGCWQIEIDAGVVTTLRDGTPTSHPAFAPAESRHRHHLALDELMIATDAAFAKHVADEARGGLDLDAAASRLGYAAKPTTRSSLRTAATNALRAVSETKRTQESLAARQRTLVRLRLRQREAEVARTRLSQLEAARRWREAADECARLTIELAALPPGVRALDGSERTRIDDFTSRRDRVVASLRTHRHELAAAGAALETVHLPRGGIGSATLATWRAQATALRQLESDLRQQESLVVRAIALVAECRRQIGDRVSDDRLATLGVTAQRRLSEFTRRMLAWTADTAHADARARSLSGSVSPSLHGVDADSLRRAIDALGRWLRTPSPTPSPTTAPKSSADSAVVGIALAIIAVLLVALAGLHHWLWLLGLVLCAALLFWTRMAGSAAAAASSDGVDEQAIHRKEYQRTRMPDPPTWDPPAVSTLLDELVRLAAQRAVADRHVTDLATLAGEQEALRTRRDALETGRAGLEQELGVPVGDDLEWLTMLISRVTAWQQARTEAAAAAAEVAELRSRADAMLESLNDSIRAAGIGAGPDADAPPAVQTAEEASTRIETLAERERARAKAADDLRRSTDAIVDAERELTAIDESIADLYRRVGLGVEDAMTLAAWLDDLPTRRELERRLHATAAIRDAHREQLGDDDRIIAFDLPAIDHAIGETTAVADERDEILRQVTQIEHEVAQAKRGHELADRLAAFDAAVTDLDAALDTASAQVVGHCIVEFIRAEEAETSRPPVFRRAAELLATFTNGTLTLVLDERDGPACFRARRGAGPVRPLDELSRGERIQLLIAVRLAFIEREESAQLPLLLDEVLATSDESRTERIIDTVIDIARSGRQVLCFTAQSDEIAKWQARLAQRDAQHAVIDLGELRGLARAEARPAVLSAPPRPALPAPECADHAAYGRQLADAGLLSGIDPRDEQQDDLHLWHLLDAPSAVHRCLSMGIANWGQLRTLLIQRSPLLAALALDAGETVRAEATARAIVRACELWRVGRGTPVDRAALADAPAVSDRMLDRVAALAQECCGDAATLVELLSTRKGLGWRQENTSALREWLADHGYLDDAPRLTVDQLRAAVLADAGHDLRDGHVAVAIVDRIVADLPS